MDYKLDGAFTPGKVGEWQFNKRMWSGKPISRNQGDPPKGMKNDLVRWAAGQPLGRWAAGLGQGAAGAQAAVPRATELLGPCRPQRGGGAAAHPPRPCAPGRARRAPPSRQGQARARPAADLDQALNPAPTRSPAAGTCSAPSTRPRTTSPAGTSTSAPGGPCSTAARRCAPAGPPPDPAPGPTRAASTAAPLVDCCLRARAAPPRRRWHCCAPPWGVWASQRLAVSPDLSPDWLGVLSPRATATGHVRPRPERAASLQVTNVSLVKLGV
jgi:hypothetical protein